MFAYRVNLFIELVFDGWKAELVKTKLITAKHKAELIFFYQFHYHTVFFIILKSTVK